jgi:hypothetical protein
MKSKYFFTIAVIAAVIGLDQVVAHQHHAGTLATAIIASDQQGLATTTQQQSLLQYTQAHMAVSETIFLAGSYNRAVQAADAAANPASNGQIYSEAQAACASHANSIVQADCVQAYVAAHSTPSTDPQAVTQPTKAAYTKTFKAPGWTTDSAGIAFLIMLVAVAMGGYLKLLRR